MSDNKDKDTKPTLFQYVKSGISGLLIGGVFGYALQRSHVYLPIVIQNQMNFTNFTMLKMFMSAASTSALAITFLDSTKLIQIEHLPVMWRRNLIGGLLMGVGIYVTGACPGTVLAQVGSGIKPAYYIFLGGLVGSAIFGYVNEWVSKIFPTATTEKPAIHQRLSVPLYKITIPFAIMIASVLYGFEKAFPWQMDSGVAPFMSSLDSLSTKVWSPYIAGIVIGSLQIPSYLLGKSGLGTSSAYVTMSSRACNLFGSCTIDYFKKFQNGLKQVFSPMLNMGIILGSYYSSLSSPPLIIDQQLNHSPIYYFVSGLLLLFGARFANGCTSGQGLTGMAKGEIGSFIAVASLFGGGVLASALNGFK